MMFFALLKMMLLVSLAMMRCLPQCAVRHTSLGEAVIIGQRPASLAEGKHHSKNAPLSVDKSAFFVGGSGWIRTTEVSDNRFTVCPLWPLGNAPLFFCVGTLAPTDDIIAHPFSFVNRFFEKNQYFFKTPTQHIYYIILFACCQQKFKHYTQNLPCKQKIILCF